MNGQHINRPRGNLLPKLGPAEKRECKSYKMDIEHYNRTGEIIPLTEPEEYDVPETSPEEKKRWSISRRATPTEGEKDMPIPAIPRPLKSELEADLKKHTIKELTEKYNCGKSTLHKWISIYGLQRDSRHIYSERNAERWTKQEEKKMIADQKYVPPGGLDVIDELERLAQAEEPELNQDIIEELKKINSCPDVVTFDNTEETEEPKIYISPARIDCEPISEANGSDGSKEEVSAIKKGKYESILMPIADLIERKNKDYGESYSLLRSEFGETAFLIRIADKFNRLKALAKSPALVNETVEDTIGDIIGYCTLELEYRRENKCV